MLRNSRIAGIAALGLALGLTTVPVRAQVTATVVTTDGHRHTGQNLGYRVDRPEVVVRTSPAEEPRIPLNQVAFVDFGGTAQPRVTLTGTQHALVLRDGTVHYGQVIEMSHVDRADQSSEYLVTFRTQDGQERRLPHNQVGRVYFNQPGQAAGAPQQPGVGPDSATVTVASQPQWTPTGITVRRGDRIRLTTSGELQIRGDRATPDGILTARREPGAPMPQAIAGALIGRVGNGQPFAVGAQSEIVAPASGPLSLGINVANATRAQVTGGFQIQLDVQRTGTGGTGVFR
jgi:hypothetical protein